MAEQTKTRKAAKKPTMEEMQKQMEEMQALLTQERKAREDAEKKLAAKGTGGRKADFASSVESYKEKVQTLLQDKGIEDNRQLYTVLQLAGKPNQDLESLAKKLGQKKSSPSTARSWGKQWVAVLDSLGILDKEQARKAGLIE